jgi:putative transposase
MQLKVSILKQKFSNLIKYVTSKRHRIFMTALKPIYRTLSKEAVEIALDKLEVKWASNI